MDSKLRISGARNTVAGRDITINISPTTKPTLLKELFIAADRKFCTEVSESGQILRLTSPTPYSSESIFTSLIRSGVPAEKSMHIIFEIVNILKELASSDQDRRELTTSDIRVAVVQAIRDLVHTGEYSNESVGMWSAAYVRRYGDPANQFIKVIDNDQEYDLNFEYINKTLLPHLLNRIMGLPKNSAPFETYRRIFSRDIVTDMSKEILSSLNSLNLYAIRYKTILYLLQDLILEPPHPWIVNEETIEKVVSYNMTMANTHLERTLNPKSTFNLEAIHQSFHEYFRHICAAILANYGAFLGTGGRYGLLELKRILGLRQTNLVLWQYCQIKNLEADLLKENSDVTALANCLTRVIAHLSYPATESKHFEDLREHASYLLRIASHICEKRI